MQPVQFFFYGTLLDGSDNPVARSLHLHLEPAGQAGVAGTLHAIPDPAGWFPAMTPGAGIVHGSLYRTKPGFGEDDLNRMDAYEDCDPENPAASLYRRQAIRLAGCGTLVQAYVYNQPLPEGARLIAEGDFRAWLAATGLAPFSGLREA
ncbi:MAG: gamma-glutamylcyclotransferase [Novosphingobium sp.]